jgi:hypothetical protein
LSQNLSPSATKLVPCLLAKTLSASYLGSRRFLTLTWANTRRRDPQIPAQATGLELGRRTVDRVDSPSCTDGHGSPFHSRAGSAVIPNRQSCRYGYRAAGEGWGLARPKPLNYSSGCPAQALLGRGCSVVTETFAIGNSACPMPWGLKHFQQSGQLHFLTFSCYRRRPNFTTPHSRACWFSLKWRAGVPR